MALEEKEKAEQKEKELQERDHGVFLGLFVLFFAFNICFIEMFFVNSTGFKLLDYFLALDSRTRGPSNWIVFFS